MNVRTLQIDDPRWLQVLESTPHDVYHLPEYSAIEARRTGAQPEAFLVEHPDTSRIFFLPYLVRDCRELAPDPSLSTSPCDIVSAYGYPGFLLSESAQRDSGFLDLAVEQLFSHWRSLGACSAFLRTHPLLNTSIESLTWDGAQVTTSLTAVTDLDLSEDQIWSDTHSGHRRAVRRCERLGVTTRCVPFRSQLSTFIEIYQDTMNRVGASETYYFSPEYFEDLASLGDVVQLLITEFKDEVVAACLFFETQGIVQAHLAGTRSEYLNLSPFTHLLERGTTVGQATRQPLLSSRWRPGRSR